VGNHVEPGIQLTADTFHGDQGAGQQQQVRRNIDVKLDKDVDEVVEQTPGMDFLQWDFIVIVDKVRYHFFQLGQDRIFFQIAGFEEQACDFFDVAFQNAEQKIDQLIFHGAVEAADHAVIEKTDDGAGQDENIARVRISVKQAVNKHLLEQGIRTVMRDGGQVVAGTAKPGKVADLDALDKLHGQNGFAGQFTVQPGHVKRVVIGEVCGKPFDGVPFPVEIQFSLNAAAKLLDQGDWVVDLEGWNMMLGKIRQAHEDVEVGGNGSCNIGPTDFDRYFFAVGKAGFMHLGNGRRGQRSLFDGGKQLADGTSEFASYLLADPLKGKGRDGVLQATEFRNVFGRQKVGTGGKQLSELDKGRPQLFHRQTKPYGGCLTSCGSGCRPAGKKLPASLHEKAELQLVENLPETVFQQRPEDLAVAAQRADVTVQASQVQHAVGASSSAAIRIFLSSFSSSRTFLVRRLSSSLLTRPRSAQIL